MTPAQQTLKTLNDQIAAFHPQERDEILDLVSKLERLTKSYGSSAEVALMVVAMQIAVGRGQ